MEIQCYDGDGVEPLYVRQKREAEEARYRRRVEQVGLRLANRERRERHRSERQKAKPIVRCERFEMRRVGNKTHFHIKSTDHPTKLIFFAGDHFREMTFRYPSYDDVRDPMRMPVVLRAVNVKVLQMHAVEPMGSDDDTPLFYETSITIESDTLINESAKVYKAFRDSICLPIPTLKGTHGSIQPGQVASSEDRADSDLPQRPRQHRAKGVVREGGAKKRPASARVRHQAVL